MPGSHFHSSHRPDFENLRRALLRREPAGPVPLIELYADPGMIELVLGEKVTWGDLALAEGRRARRGGGDASDGGDVLDLVLRFCAELGYDYVYAWTGLAFPRANYRVSEDVATAENWSGGRRVWQDESTGPIQSWADFERYPWPTLEGISYRAIEYLNETVPDGMKIAVNLSGIFENASWLMGLESFSYALVDEPELVAAIFQRVGDLTVAAADHALSCDNVGLVFLGDDLGCASGLLVAPGVLRTHVFAHYRRLAERVHAADRLLLLHCCGNVASIMDELIELGFDGKHSFEDKIMPVEEIHRRWGERISILGGVDMDLLARRSEAEVRRRTREILDVCGRRGTGYALGTGNSVANYLPRENYLAMLDEGRRWNREHFGRA